MCDTLDLNGATCVFLGYSGGGLLDCTNCMFDVSNCVTTSSLTVTGQTSSYGTGSDGYVQAGAPFLLTDNSDGTITDQNTGLMWEKKKASGAGLHHVDESFTWCEDSAPVDGTCDNGLGFDETVVSVFLATLNDVAGAGANCFAGHCDWRLPNYKELVTILHLDCAVPTISEEFHHTLSCNAGCFNVTLSTCSCTSPRSYWTSTVNFSAIGGEAWMVDFMNGEIFSQGITAGHRARAVRGGL
ncbi:MAG: hypothetical protein ACI91F_002303 [Candidatus Binatia bacterium]|jgi:hypothetical protein